MASKTKQIKSKAANPGQLKQEKEEAVQVKHSLYLLFIHLGRRPG
jgi:hypothetical protein